jgi:hypothetical protein
MELISDILLIAGAAGAAFYCIVLSRRLSRFTNLEKGVGGAIAVLSAQVDDMTRALADAQGTATGSTTSLAALTDRAEEVAGRLELLVASMHDLPSSPEPGSGPQAAPAAPRQDASPKPVPEAKPTSPPGDLSQDPAPALFRSHRGWIREAAE